MLGEGSFSIPYHKCSLEKGCFPREWDGILGRLEKAFRKYEKGRGGQGGLRRAGCGWREDVLLKEKGWRDSGQRPDMIERAKGCVCIMMPKDRIKHLVTQMYAAYNTNWFPQIDHH